MKLLIWIAGWSCPAYIWDEQIRLCSPAYSHYKLDFNSCTDINGFLDKELIKASQTHSEIYVIGWSLGAMALLDLLSSKEFPQIKALIAIAGVAQFVQSQSTPRGYSLDVLKQMRRSLERDLPGTIAQFDKRLFKNNEQALLRWQNQVRSSQDLNLEYVLAGLDYLTQLDIYAKLERLRLNTYFWAGGKDLVCPPENIKSTCNKIKSAELTVWSEEGHAPFWTQPLRFNRWLQTRGCFSSASSV